MPKPTPGTLRLAEYEGEEVDVGSLTIVSATSSSQLSPDVRLASPSTPDLAVPPTRPGLVRSATLPKSESRINSSSLGAGFVTLQQSLEADVSLLQKIRRWILGIALVDFDIDHGPVVSGIYPPVVLLPKELENIAFSSFPDSLQFDQGSQIHSFRIRVERIADRINQTGSGADDGFIYGFSHFTQKRDERSRRGYEQRSVVILSILPYPAFFCAILDIFGPMFHEHGVAMLEAACHSIATWPSPSPGSVLEIGFLGTVLHVEIPHSGDDAQQPPTQNRDAFDPRVYILASSPPLTPPPLLLFQTSLSHLWSIWECLILCEPILVYAMSPAETSQAMWFFRDLVRPIPLALDIRPYFTIHDSDRSLLLNNSTTSASSKSKSKSNPPKQGIILGVTNPYFTERECRHWPNILSLGGEETEGYNLRNGMGLNTATPSPMPTSVISMGLNTAPVSSASPANTSTGSRFRQPLTAGIGIGIGSSSARSRHLHHNLPRQPPTAGPSVGVGSRIMGLGPSPPTAGITSGSGLGSGVGGGRGGGGKTIRTGPPPGWTTKYHKRYISKDRVLLRQLEEALSGGSEEQKISASLALRLHFCSRTNEVLVPLTRYLHTLIPKPSEVQGASSGSGSRSGPDGGGGTGSALKLKPFNTDNFFASLKAGGSTLPFRSGRKRVEFYERWLKTPAFGLWLAQQEGIVQDVLNGSGGGGNG